MDMALSRGVWNFKYQILQLAKSVKASLPHRKISLVLQNWNHGTILITSLVAHQCTTKMAFLLPS
jgi:hypothetical protein